MYKPVKSSIRSPYVLVRYDLVQEDQCSKYEGFYIAKSRLYCLPCLGFFLVMRKSNPRLKTREEP